MTATSKTTLTWTTAVFLSLTLLNGCNEMATSVPRTMVQTSDLSPDDFGLLAGKVVSRTGLSGPYQLLSGTIDDYENQSGKPELVWIGGTEEDPFCIWVSYPGGAYLKLKWPTPSEAGFCQSVLDCIVSDLERGGGTRERYLIPELTGPDWQIVEVLYGDGDDAQFGLIEGSSLIDLMGELNGAETLPEDWLFSIDGGVLVLSVPHGTNVTSIELGSGAVVEFDGPSFDGAPGSTLTDPLTVALAGPLELIIQQYEELLTTYTGLLGESVEFSVATTEAGVESAYSAYLKATVRWTDADGDPRISYKTPTNVWYHPAEKEIEPHQVFSDAGNTGVTPTEEFNAVVGVGGVPADAKFVKIAMQAVNGSSGAIIFMLETDEVTAASGNIGIYASIANILLRNVFDVKVRSDGTVGFYYDSSSTTLSLASAKVIGWRR